MPEHDLLRQCLRERAGLHMRFREWEKAKLIARESVVELPPNTRVEVDEALLLRHAIDALDPNNAGDAAVIAAILRTVARSRRTR
jgi:hypothetical protein